MKTLDSRACVDPSASRDPAEQSRPERQAAHPNLIITHGISVAIEGTCVHTWSFGKTALAEYCGNQRCIANRQFIGTWGMRVSASGEITNRELPEPILTTSP